MSVALAELGDQVLHETFQIAPQQRSVHRLSNEAREFPFSGLRANGER